MSSLKSTSFLEAVAAGIQHEKDFFDFCMKTHDDLKSGAIKNFFFDLAEDSEDHIKMIEGIYQKYSGSASLPNLKHLGQVHKFHATAIQKLIKKLDRNLKKSAHGSELEALRLALQETEDAVQAFAKLADKLPDPGTKMLFKQMSNFNKDRAVLLEGSMVFQHQAADHDAAGDFHRETMDITIEAQKQPAKKAAKKPLKKPVKKVKAVKKPAKKKTPAKKAKKKK